MSFSFGTPSSAPANTSLSSGFSFGANKPAATGFGLATSQPSTGLFGSTPATSTPAFGTATAFGASSTPGFGASTGFGTTETPSFGATSTAPTFGTTTPAFGATSTAPAFGATSAAPTFGTPSFGAASAAPTFGSTTTPAFGATSSAGAFGQTGLGGLNFGTGSNTSTAASLAPTSTTGGLGGLSFPAATTQSTLGFPSLAASTGGLFEQLPLSSAMFPRQPLGSPSIPITQTFQMIPPSQSPRADTITRDAFGNSCNIKTRRFDLIGPKRDCYRTISPSPGPKLGTTTVSSSLPVLSVSLGPGLGGIAPTGAGAGSTTGDGKVEPPKQTKLPNELSATVDSFKEFVKKQKSLSSEMMRLSIKPLHKVSVDAEALVRSAQALRGEVSRARAQSRRLRAAAAAATAAAEAHADPGLELDNPPPPAYIKELVVDLEQQLSAFRRQMELADKQMQAEPKLLTEQELTLGMRRMHSALVALAARLQAAHARVLAARDQFRDLHSRVLRQPGSSSLDKILQDAEGRKKSRLNPPPSARAVLPDPRAALAGNIQQLAGPTPFSYVGNSISSFPGSDATGPSWQAPVPEPTLQLQRPPGKRGKQ